MITVPFTFVATVAAIEYAGAKPVLVDVEPEFLTMDPAKLEAAITPRTKAIIPVHLFGQPADMDPIMAIARKHKLVVIEDACQAHGSEYKGKRCGSIGQLGCFSFYPGKNLGAYGEGGAVVTSDPELAKKIRLLRAWGEETRYEHKYRGFNYRMDGVQGAVLGVKLRHLEAWTEARRRNAAEYGRRLADTSATAAARTPRRAARVSPVRRASPAARCLARPAERGRRADRRALSDSRSPAARVSRSWLLGRRLPGVRAGAAAKCCRCRCSRS